MRYESDLKKYIRRVLLNCALTLGTRIEVFGKSDKFLVGWPDLEIYTINKPFFIEAKSDSSVYGFTEEQLGVAEVMHSNLGIDVYGIEGNDSHDLLVYMTLESTPFRVSSIYPFLSTAIIKASGIKT